MERFDRRDELRRNRVLDTFTDLSPLQSVLSVRGFIWLYEAVVLQGSILKLKQLIASSCRQKVIATLAKEKRTHITGLVRMANSTYNQVKCAVTVLEKEGIVKTKSLGHLKIVELEMDNPKTQALLKAMSILDYTENVQSRRRTDGTCKESA